VRFWDSSALLPLFIAEAESGRARRWLADDPVVVVWTLTRVELLWALARRRRERSDADIALSTARREALSAWERWTEITSVDAVRRHAERLVETHPLRAGDALQLGAALVAAVGRSADLEFVTLDDRQAEAAVREGFRVLGPR
jgi:predicted nucleic acid-binding protein